MIINYTLHTYSTDNANDKYENCVMATIGTPVIITNVVKVDSYNNNNNNYNNIVCLCCYMPRIIAKPIM